MKTNFTKSWCRCAAILLSFATLLVSMISCGGNGGGDTTTPETTEAAPTMVDIIKDGTTEYTIIRGEEASDAIIQSVMNFRKKLNSRINSGISIDSDWVKRDEEVDNSQPEILIGETNRDASIEVIASLEPNSWTIKVVGNKLVIAGTDDNQTAAALYIFEDRFLYNKDYISETDFSLPSDTEYTISQPKLATMEGVIDSSHPTIAVATSLLSISGIDGFGTAQGAATDGLYFYNVLKKNVDGVETDIIVKTSMADLKTVLVSAELPLDHANDMCYNPVENILVIPNMVGKKLTVIDPETLTIIKTVDATSLPDVCYAIAYDVNTGGYIIAAGGKLNFTDKDFVVQFSAAKQSVEYTSQGMDADENYIYMPHSASSTYGTTTNIIVIYSAVTGGYVKTVTLDLTAESETIMHYDGVYYLNFNTSGARISKFELFMVY